MLGLRWLTINDGVGAKQDNTSMTFGDAKQTLQEIVSEFKAG
jgi:hypothetical protein